MYDVCSTPNTIFKNRIDIISWANVKKVASSPVNNVQGYLLNVHCLQVSFFKTSQTELKTSNA